MLVFDMNGNIRRFSAAMALMVHGKSLAFAAGDPLHEHGMAGAVFMGPQVRNALRQVASDVDLLVEFAPLSPPERADAYFGLLESLEHLLGVRVDLVEPGPIRNPYLRKAIDETRVVIYEAA